MVGINEVLHNDVMENLAFLLNHLIQHRVCVFPQQKERGNLDALEVVLVSPGLSNGLSRIKFFVSCADKNDQKRGVLLTFFRFIDEKIK